MNAQRRRVAADSDALGVTVSYLDIDQDEADVANVHGVSACFSLEPENADANANGFWVLWCLPGPSVIQNSDLPHTIGQLGDQKYAPYIWGMGCWTASNQAPFHYEFRPKTSRNCQKDARIKLQIENLGVSAGLVRVIRTMTLFQSS